MSNNDKKANDDGQSVILTPPKQFVSLHNHTGFSPYDGLGYPNEHFDWCIENGLDAHAITEHGNMSSYAHAALHIEGWNSKNPNKQFKYIPGVEAYYHPDLDAWAKEKALVAEARTAKAAALKLQKSQEKFKTKIITKIDKDDEIEEIELSNSLTIEDEDNTKSNKVFNPLNRRHHLVLLPKNEKGLLNVFSAVSNGYINGYYRFPRIDNKVIKNACKDGNVIASTACLGGPLSWAVFQEVQQIAFDDLSDDLLNDPSLMNKCLTSVGNFYDEMTDAIGRDNLYLELQFNRLSAQNMINRVLLEFANRNGLNDQLIVTCDAHYARPEYWKDRELYKKLGYLNYKDYSADSLPNSKSDLKCELYPKNSMQIWDEYKTSKSESSGYYGDQIVKDAIERTYHIAHNVLGDIKPDRSPKFPTKLLTPEGTEPIHHLISLCKDGLRARGLAKKPKYIERLKEELGVIKTMGSADYFISYQKIMELAKQTCLAGPARGCFIPGTDVMMSDGNHKNIEDILECDEVIDAFGNTNSVTETFTYEIDEEIVELEFENGTKITCTKDHKFLTTNRGWVPADELTDDDEIAEVTNV